MNDPLFPKSPADLLPTEEALKLDGLEYMQGLLDGKLPAATISETLNYRLSEVEEGKITFRGSPQFNALNPMGTVHGGWYGTVLDSAMACAIATQVPKGYASTTLEFKVNIIRPIPTGMEVIIVGETDHVGRSTGVATGRIFGADNEKLYATASTTCFVFKVAPAS